MNQSTHSRLTLGSGNIGMIEHELLGRHISDIGLTTPERFHTAKHRVILARAEEIRASMQDFLSLDVSHDFDDSVEHHEYEWGKLTCECCDSNSPRALYVRDLRVR